MPGPIFERPTFQCVINATGTVETAPRRVDRFDVCLDSDPASLVSPLVTHLQRTPAPTA